jgi:hypothetical protein
MRAGLTNPRYLYIYLGNASVRFRLRWLSAQIINESLIGALLKRITAYPLITIIERNAVAFI